MLYLTAEAKIGLELKGISKAHMFVAKLPACYAPPEPVPRNFQLHFTYEGYHLVKVRVLDVVKSHATFVPFMMTRITSKLTLFAGVHRLEALHCLRTRAGHPGRGLETARVDEEGHHRRPVVAGVHQACRPGPPSEAVLQRRPAAAAPDRHDNTGGGWIPRPGHCRGSAGLREGHLLNAGHHSEAGEAASRLCMIRWE